MVSSCYIIFPIAGTIEIPVYFFSKLKKPPKVELAVRTYSKVMITTPSNIIVAPVIRS
jgi:hypothetical protein